MTKRRATPLSYMVSIYDDPNTPGAASFHLRAEERSTDPHRRRTASSGASVCRVRSRVRARDAFQVAQASGAKRDAGGAGEHRPEARDGPPRMAWEAPEADRFGEGVGGGTGLGDQDRGEEDGGRRNWEL